MDSQERDEARNGDPVRAAMMGLRRGHGRIIGGVIFPRCPTTGCDHETPEDCFPAGYKGGEFWANPSCYLASSVCGHCSHGEGGQFPGIGDGHDGCTNLKYKDGRCLCLCTVGGRVE